MPRPLNANLPDTVWADAENYAAPGDDWDGTPTKVEPDVGLWTPDERPPAPMFNHLDNRREKILRYLDLIDLLNWTLPYGIADGPFRAIDYTGVKYIAGGAGDSGGDFRLASSPTGLGDWFDETAQLTNGLGVSDVVQDVLCLGAYAYAFATVNGYHRRDDSEDYTTTSIKPGPVGTSYLLYGAWRNPDAAELWIGVRQRVIAGVNWITIIRVTSSGYVYASGGVFSSDGLSGWGTGGDSGGAGMNERVRFTSLPGVLVCMVTGDNMPTYVARSVDAGTTWASVNVPGMNSLTLVGLATVGSTIYASFTNGATWTSQDGISWSAGALHATYAAEQMIGHGDVALSIGRQREYFGGTASFAAKTRLSTGGNVWRDGANPTATNASVDGRFLRSMQDGRVAILTVVGEECYVSYSLRTNFVDVTG